MLVKINLEDTYEILTIAPDYSEATFNSIDVDGKPALLKISITPVDNPHLPNVYNLGFGPIGLDGEIDDKARISHKDRNKVYSTLIFFGYTFLLQNPKYTIGLDGSDFIRAAIYHRIFQTNRVYLEDYFIALGVDNCVRFKRNGEYEKDATGAPLLKPRPEPFDYKRSTKDLYWYYMFHLTKKGQ
jgi:hypothetical protein